MICKTIAVCLLFFVISCVSFQSIQSTKINGKDAIQELNYYNKDSKILYDVFHDKQNIYVNMKTSDYFTQVKILEFGLTIWFNQNGKKSKNKGIIFPQKSESLRSKQTRNKGNRNSYDKEEQKIKQLHTKFQLSQKNIFLIGMNGKNSKTIFNPELEKSDIIAKITFGKFNELNYFATIPKNKIITDKKQRLIVGIESGAMEMKNKQGQGRSGDGMSGHSGGGMKGGGMKGGGGRPGGKMGSNIQEYSTLSKPINIWFSVDL